MAEEEVQPVSYEDLAQIEHEFDEIDVEIIRRQYILSAPVYAKRQAAIAKIPNFWPLVFEQAPQDVDQFIQPSDSEVFGKHLIGLDVQRFEIPLDSDASEDESKGDPRSLVFRFEFSENDWFSDSVLEKKFWYRRASDGWVGLVSEPVKINWKKGKDLTHGLTEGAIKLWEARRAAGEMLKKDLPEYHALAKIVEQWNGANTSFFTWFAFVSSRRYVSEQESVEATKEDKARRTKVEAGETDEFSGIPDDDPTEQQVEVFEDGDELATVIAEDVWPSATKYFTEAQEDEGDLSEMEFEDDEDVDDEADDEPIDIRSLVRDRDLGHSPDERQRKKARK